MPATIKHHESPHDWCHLCGERSDTTAGVWWAENAEHDRGPVNRRDAVAGRRYVRACYQCAEKIALAADLTRPMRDCGRQPDDRAECWSVEHGRPICDLCSGVDAVEIAIEAITQECADLSAMVMRLANALALDHGARHGHAIDHGDDDCEACDALAATRRWAQ